MLCIYGSQRYIIAILIRSGNRRFELNIVLFDLSEDINRSLLVAILRLHIHGNCITFLVHRYQLVNACRGDGEVRNELRTIRQVHKDGVVLDGSSIGTEVRRVIYRRYRRTLENDVIDRTIAALNVGVLTVVHYLCCQLTVNPLAIVKPLDCLRLVLYLTRELKRRNANIIIGYGNREGLIAQLSVVAIHFRSGQRGVEHHAHVTDLEVSCKRLTTIVDFITTAFCFTCAKHNVQFAYRTGIRQSRRTGLPFT